MLKVLCKSFPTHLTLLATPIEPFSYHFDCQLIKLHDAQVIFADAIVLEMASKLGCKDLPPVFSLDQISNRFQPVIHLCILRRTSYGSSFAQA